MTIIHLPRTRTRPLGDTPIFARELSVGASLRAALRLQRVPREEGPQRRDAGGADGDLAFETGRMLALWGMDGKAGE